MIKNLILRRQTLIQKLQERLGKRTDNAFTAGEQKDLAGAKSEPFFHQEGQSSWQDEYQFPSHGENGDVSMCFEASEHLPSQETSAERDRFNDMYLSMPPAPMVQEAPAAFPGQTPTAGRASSASSSRSRWPCQPISISEQSPPSVAYVGPKDGSYGAAEQTPGWDFSAASPGWRPLCGGSGPKAAASPSAVLGLLTPGSRGGGSLTWDSLRPALTPGAASLSTPGLCLGGLAATPGSSLAGVGVSAFTPRFGWAAASPGGGAGLGGWGGGDGCGSDPPGVASATMLGWQRR